MVREFSLTKNKIIIIKKKWNPYAQGLHASGEADGEGNEGSGMGERGGPTYTCGECHTD